MAQSRPSQSQSQPLPALPENAFHHAYGTWCSKHRVINKAVSIEGRVVDLHKLHTEVLSAAPVITPVQWQMIAGRLGFIHSHISTQKGPLPVSSSEVAAKLQKVYRVYLQEFDAVYLGSSSSSSMRFVICPEGAP